MTYQVCMAPQWPTRFCIVCLACVFPCQFTIVEAPDWSLIDMSYKTYIMPLRMDSKLQLPELQRDCQIFRMWRRGNKQYYCTWNHRVHTFKFWHLWEVKQTNDIIMEADDVMVYCRLVRFSVNADYLDNVSISCAIMWPYILLCSDAIRTVQSNRVQYTGLYTGLYYQRKTYRI